MDLNFKNDVEAADQFKECFQKLKKEIGKKIVGQEEIVELLITAIFCQGHCLLVGVPGLAKTLLIQTIAKALDLDFNRIQFTPDLMPSDILGAETLNADRQFSFNKGPIFSNIILADEINRTPPKTQSALLESMQEYTVTIAGKNFDLDKPFFVLATQNPIEQEGTYPLPEAQLDRFIFMLNLDYPNFNQEIEIVKSTTSEENVKIDKILDKQAILIFQQLIRRVPINDNVVQYAVKLVQKTRPSSELADTFTKDYIEWGAGPRASQNLVLAAKVHALSVGKYSPDIEDIQFVAKPVLRHRIVKNFRADAEGISVDEIINKLM